MAYTHTHTQTKVEEKATEAIYVLEHHMEANPFELTQQSVSLVEPFPVGREREHTTQYVLFAGVEILVLLDY